MTQPLSYDLDIVEGPDVDVLIDVKGRRGTEQRALTCSEHHGELGQWPVVAYEDETEPELAWDEHVAEQHHGKAIP